MGAYVCVEDGQSRSSATTTPPTRCSPQEDRAGQAVTVETIRRRRCRQCRKLKRNCWKKRKRSRRKGNGRLERGTRRTQRSRTREVNDIGTWQHQEKGQTRRP